MQSNINKIRKFRENLEGNKVLSPARVISNNTGGSENHSNLLSLASNGNVAEELTDTNQTIIFVSYN
jgi:hypothetical protein